MDPIRLQIENFCRHEYSDISFLDFPSALIIGKIKGNDRFSNGVGKSTIFAAIKYVLFNEVDASTLEQVIRHGTDFCRVAFEFISALDGLTYRITRTKNKKAGSEVLLHKSVNGEWENLTQRRNQDTEKEIAKIIKINYKTFLNSTLFSQSDLTGLATLTPEKRKLALKEALQLNVYGKYEIAVKKKTAELVKEIDREKIILNTIGDPSADIIKFNKELEEIDELVLSKNKLLYTTKQTYDLEYERLLKLTKTCETLEREAIDAIGKQKSLQDEIAKISSTLNDYRKKVSTVRNAGTNLSNEISELSKQLQGLQSLSLRNKDFVKSEIENSTQELISKKASFNSKISKLEELRIPLPTGSTCRHCRQKINFTNQEERDACQKAIDADIKDLEMSIKSHQGDITKQELVVLKLKEEVKNIESIESKIVSIKALLDAKNKDVNSKREVHSEYANLLGTSMKLMSAKEHELDLMKQNQHVGNAVEYTALKLELKNVRARVASLAQEIEDHNKILTVLLNNKAVLAHKIEQRINDQEKIKSSLDNISKLEELYVIHQKVIHAFGSTGIPALITHTILDDFQIETNLWLAKLRPGLQSQFSVIKDRVDGDQEDTLAISYMLDGHDMEYALLSGAQKFIVALSLKLGLASVIKKRLGVEMRLLLIDEVDQCLDSGSLEAFESAIRQLQQDFKVLVITHNNELKAKFNHAILVEQDENLASRAKVVNTW